MIIDFNKIEKYYKILWYTRKEFASKIWVVYVTYTSWSLWVKPNNTKDILKKVILALNEWRAWDWFKKYLLKKIKINDLLE